jgi:thymidine phosphorylase
MSQPLGDAVGNALDVAEAVELLRGGFAGRLRNLALWFAARALEATEAVPFDEGLRLADRAVASGAALERFARMVEAQGGDPRVVDDPGHVLPSAPVILPLLAEQEGTLAAVDAEAVGLASGALGAGRTRKGEAIDPAVGIVLRCKIGDGLAPGEPIGEIHARTEEAAADAARRVLEALELVDRVVEPPPLVHHWFGVDG